jgi:hypothetical protein
MNYELEIMGAVLILRSILSRAIMLNPNIPNSKFKTKKDNFDIKSTIDCFGF